MPIFSRNKNGGLDDVQAKVLVMLIAPVPNRTPKMGNIGLREVLVQLAWVPMLMLLRGEWVLGGAELFSSYSG